MPHRFARHAALTFLSIALIACSGDGPTGDRQPPTVLSLSPADGASGVARTTSISATLSEPLDPATVNTATFLVIPPGGVPIAGTVAVDGNVVTFTPSVPLAHGVSYLAWLTDGVSDLAGNVLRADVSWTFTVEPNAA